MSANFYKNSARMLGIDFHPYHTLPTSLKEMATGHRIDAWPHGVTEQHSFAGGDEEKRTHKVTAEREPMIRDGFTLRGFTHIPFPLPFHPYEAIVGTKVKADAKSTPLLKASTVTSEGDPLAVCAVGLLGFNLNCNEAGMKMTAVVICVCSVKTAPTQKDLILKLFDEYFKKMWVKLLTDIFDVLLKMRKLPKPAHAILVWIYRKFITAVLSILDGLLHMFWFLAEWTDERSRVLLPEPKPEPQLPEPAQDQPSEEQPSEDPPKPPDLDPIAPDWQEQQRQHEEQRQKEYEERERKRSEDKQRERNKPFWQP